MIRLIAPALIFSTAAPIAAQTIPGRNAFAMPFPGLEPKVMRSHAVGNSFFNQNWVASPASTTARDGLGPHFQARSCSACHFKDGRGAPPTSPDETPLALLFRVSKNGGQPLDVYGTQANQRSLPGITPLADARVSWIEKPGTFDDGTPYSLRRPNIEFTFHHGEPDPATFEMSPRIANPVFGLGLLEATPTAAILANADPHDLDRDGISGRPHILPDGQIGRFGWKATQPTIRSQTSAAFHGDIGISSTDHPDPQAPDAEPEISDRLLQHITTYLRTIAPPAARETPNSEVGATLFSEIGCVKCHTPEFQTGSFPDLPALSNRTFHPFTDLLLHDMGEGLADHRIDIHASGTEWRTPPLWGIGLTSTVNNHTFYLHDGRARNVEEAILWHGGEAAPAQSAYRALPTEQRTALLDYISTL